MICNATTETIGSKVFVVVRNSCACTVFCIDVLFFIWIKKVLVKNKATI
jgi:hypothetical protein